MLCAVGDLIEDVVAHLEGAIRTGADVTASITRHRGGSAANVAAAAARLTGRSRFVGAIGADRIGDAMVRDLETLGVDCRVQQTGTTGAIVALVDATGERSFVTDRGASPTLTLAHDELLDAVTVLHLAGYGLAGGEISETVADLASAAHRRGIPVAVDPSSTSVGDELGTEAYRRAIAALAPDVVLPNRVEAEQLDLLGHPLAPLTVVTAGAEPTTVVEARMPEPPDGTGAEPRVAQMTRVTVRSLDVALIDSTGAGDAFAAGFLTEWVAGRAVVDAVVAGHAAAAHVIGGPGGDHWS